MSEERLLWKATIMNGDGCERVAWIVCDDIGQALNWVNPILGDEDEIIQIEQVTLVEILPSGEGQTRVS